MKRIRNFLIILTLLALAFGGWQLRNDITDLQYRISLSRFQPCVSEVISDVMPSVVYVEADRWSGSGVIVGPRVVLTAGHVVEDANWLGIITVDGGRYEAKMWVRHPDTDLGLLFFDEEVGPVAKFSDSVIVGEQVIAIGSPYGKGFFNTVTTGIISGINRNTPFYDWQSVITSDVEANPGNSGGPVFNMRSELIGIVVGTYSWYGNGIVIIPGGLCQKLLQ